MQPERVARVARLYDAYGTALTPRQRRVLELVCLEDLSLGEAAGQLAISRQGVHDLLHRAEAALEDYERRLGLAARRAGEREALGRVRAILEDLAARFPAEPGVGQALALVGRLLEET